MEDKKRINYIFVDSDVLSMIVEMANRRGESIASCAGQVLEDAIENWHEPTADEPDRRIYWSWIKFKRDKKRRERIYQAAAIYQNNPTETLADELAQMCEDADIDYKAVIQEVANDPFSSLIANSRNGSTLGSCIQWLTKFLREHPEGVPVRIAEIIAERKGFSRGTFKRARQAINNDLDSPSVESQKIGRAWYISIQEEESSVSDKYSDSLSHIQ